MVGFLVNRERGLREGVVSLLVSREKIWEKIVNDWFFLDGGTEKRRREKVSFFFIFGRRVFFLCLKEFRNLSSGTNMMGNRAGFSP